MINEVIIQGRLTRDPDLRHTKNNKAVSSFTVAVDRSRKTDGQPEADFIPCVAWGKSAEFISKWFEKGQAIVLSGSIRSRSWTDRNDNKRTSIEVVTEEISFGEPKRERGSTKPAIDAGTEYTEPEFSELDDDDGEVPF
jgi:single-strand DNA-binding protein